MVAVEPGLANETHFEWVFTGVIAAAHGLCLADLAISS